MTKKKKKQITYSVIGIIIVALVGWWGWGAYERVQNAVPPSDIDVITAHEKGNLEGKLVMVEFSDFQCPACRVQQEFVDAALDSFPEMKLIFKHFPLETIHPNAYNAAIAAEAAGVQGAFWEMHDILFERQDEWSNFINPQNKFIEYAEELGLEVEQFRADLENEVVIAKVDADVAEGDALGLNSTPSFFINGERITTDQEFLEAVGQGV